MLGTTVRGAGSAVGHIDPTRWEQAHGRRRQQACARSTRRWRSPSACWPVLGASVPLARFESLYVNAQGFRFQRLPRQAELGRRAGWAGHPAAALRQGGFDEFAFVLGACRHQGPGRPGPQRHFPLEPALLDGKGVALTQDDGALNGPCTCPLRINTAGSSLDHYRVKKFYKRG